LYNNISILFSFVRYLRDTSLAGKEAYFAELHFFDATHHPKPVISAGGAAPFVAPEWRNPSSTSDFS